MISRFPGVCTCGCGRRFPPGAELERGASGWVLAACAAPARPAPGTAAEIIEILDRAKVVAARVLARNA